MGTSLQSISGLKINERFVFSLVVLAIIGIFAVDLKMPLGVAVWLLYIPPLLLSLWKLKPATTIFFTVTCTILIFLAFCNITASVNDPKLALLNRSLAIGMLWLTVFLGVLYKRALARIEILASDLTTRAAELEAANRELEAFSYTVSHDLRKPLTSIIGYSEIIQELHAESLDSEGKEYLRIIYDESLKMDHLVDTLLKFSILSEYSITRGTVNLSEIANDIASDLQRAQPDRAVTFDIAEGLIEEADSRLMRVVLENLFQNAWKYTSEKSDAKIEFGVADSEERKAYFVHDNGVGFDMSKAYKLFDAFQRLHSGYEGMGIGLATVKRIIDRHGGMIWADGEEGAGATFYFCL